MCFAFAMLKRNATRTIFVPCIISETAQLPISPDTITDNENNCPHASSLITIFLCTLGILLESTFGNSLLNIVHDLILWQIIVQTTHYYVSETVIDMTKQVVYQPSRPVILSRHDIMAKNFMYTIQIQFSILNVIFKHI